MPDRVYEGLTAVGTNGDQFVDVADVGEKVAVAEDVDGGLVVEEHPYPVRGVVGAVLAEVVSLLVSVLSSDPVHGV